MLSHQHSQVIHGFAFPVDNGQPSGLAIVLVFSKSQLSMSSSYSWLAVRQNISRESAAMLFIYFQGPPSYGLPTSTAAIHHRYLLFTGVNSITPSL
jgi:hypothetical protein